MIIGGGCANRFGREVAGLSGFESSGAGREALKLEFAFGVGERGAGRRGSQFTRACGSGWPETESTTEPWRVQGQLEEGMED